jgi:hypothetical protein
MVFINPRFKGTWEPGLFFSLIPRPVGGEAAINYGKTRSAHLLASRLRYAILPPELESERSLIFVHTLLITPDLVRTFGIVRTAKDVTFAKRALHSKPLAKQQKFLGKSQLER